MAGYFTDKEKKLHQFAGGDNSTKYCLPVGTIFPSAIPLTDASVHLLDGSTISQTGVYQEFAELLKSLVSAGYNISCSQNDFNNEVSATGNCGKFVINDTLNIIRLPKITRFIQGLSNMIDIGDSVEAGLPNIKGSITRSDEAYPLIFGYNQNLIEEGALSSKWQTCSNQVDSSTGATSAKRSVGFKFDASKSSSIYGNSSTVQPQATSYPYYIVLASGFSNDVKLNIDNVMTEVNGKLPLAGGTLSGALNIEGITNKEKAISIESPDSDAMVSLTRTDVGNSIGVGIGGNGTARGIWDEALQKWLIMHDNSALKLNGSSTRPKYNSKDLAFYSDLNPTYTKYDFKTEYISGNCRAYRIGQFMFINFDTIAFAVTSVSQEINLLTKTLPRPTSNVIFMLTPHDTNHHNVRMGINAYSGALVSWWGVITLAGNYQGSCMYKIIDGD